MRERALEMDRRRDLEERRLGRGKGRGGECSAHVGGGDGMVPGGPGGIFLGTHETNFFGRTRPGHGAKLDSSFSPGHGSVRVFV
jgi:hypothetical protein